jgi:hypothetical protein
VFAYEVNDAPAAVALLEMGKSERGNLGSPKAASEKNGEDSPIAQSPYCRDVGSVEQTLRLAHRKPVPHADARRFRALHAGDPGREFRRQQPVIGGFGRQVCWLRGWAKHRL